MAHNRLAASIRQTSYPSVWRDAAVVAGVALLSVILSAHFEVNETMFALTRRWEHLELDELLIGMLVFSTGMLWLAWRRYRQAFEELRARQAAEVQLAQALAENRQLAHEHIRLQEAERKHLARELHDQLGQYLNAIKLDAVAIHDNGDTTPAQTAAAAIIHSVDHVNAVVGDMIRRLRPVGLDELGLIAAIENCIDHWRQRRPGICIALSVSGAIEELSEPLTLTIYRLIQEGLTNAFQHAEARHIDIRIQRSASAANNRDELRLTVVDDGRGMDPQQQTYQFGLKGMRERVELAGGAFALRSTPGQGLSIAACLPVESR